jgi:hypothetical protein
MSIKMKCIEEVLKKQGLTVDTSEGYIGVDGYDRLNDKVWIRIGLHYDDQRRGLVLDNVYEAEETEENAMPPLGAFKQKTDDYGNAQYVKNLIDKIKREIAETCG